MTDIGNVEVSRPLDGVVHDQTEKINPLRLLCCSSVYLTLSDMSASKFSCFDSYRKWVIANPETLSQIETIGRFLSYLIAGIFQKISI